MPTTLNLQPFLKWAGGKRQLLPELRKYISQDYGTYFEPFLGAGAVLFDLQPAKALINDVNPELINCYNTIKEHPQALLDLTREHQSRNCQDYYYEIRSRDRNLILESMSNIERAARIIYLNKTCYNGLFRVNRQGQFNVPYGNHKNPTIADDEIIWAISNYLNQTQITITNSDFADALQTADCGDFIYLDPPYDPVSDTSFTGYGMTGFGKEQQHRLRNVCDDLTSRGCQVLISNSATDFINQLYGDQNLYAIAEVQANRSINSVGSARGKIGEVIICNKYCWLDRQSI
jgi:DNA adenine methylase